MTAKTTKRTPLMQDAYDTYNWYPQMLARFREEVCYVFEIHTGIRRLKKETDAEYHRRLLSLGWSNEELQEVAKGAL